MKCKKRQNVQLEKSEWWLLTGDISKLPKSERNVNVWEEEIWGGFICFISFCTDGAWRDDTMGFSLWCLFNDRVLEEKNRAQSN